MNKKETKLGRPSRVKAMIKTHSVQFGQKTNHEMVSFLLEKTPIREVMKSGDEATLRRNLYVSVRNVREQGIKVGKKLEFKGRKVGDLLKKKWLRGKKAAKV